MYFLYLDCKFLILIFENNFFFVKILTITYYFYIVFLEFLMKFAEDYMKLSYIGSTLFNLFSRIF